MCDKRCWYEVKSAKRIGDLVFNLYDVVAVGPIHKEADEYQFRVYLSSGRDLSLANDFEPLVALRGEIISRLLDLGRE